MRSHFLAAAVGVMVSVGFSITSVQADGLLRVSPDNTRYLTDNSGQPIYLAGSEAWYVINNDAAHPGSIQRATDFANWLQGWGMNYTRYWSGGSYLSTGILPWNRNGAGTAADGLPKVDFTSYNTEYFDRLKFQVTAFQDRGIYSSLMFFGSFNSMRATGTYQSDVAWNPANNVNNLGMSSTDGNTFFNLSNTALVSVQEAHIRKMVDELNSYDNIVWEIMNEPKYPNSFAWQQHMVDYVRTYEATKPKQHLVVMSGGWSESANTLETSAANIISPDGSNSGDYWNGGPAAYKDKVVMNDTDHLWGYSYTAQANTYRQFVWKTFARGNNTLFMDNYDSVANGSPGVIQPEFDPVRKAMKATVAYSKRLDLAKAIPSTTVSSTTFALVEPGEDYLIYQPGSGTFTVNLVAGSYNYEWYNPQTNLLSLTGSLVAPGGNMSFSAPFAGDAVLYLSAVPEPATLALFSGLGVLAIRRNRREPRTV